MSIKDWICSTELKKLEEAKKVLDFLRLKTTSQNTIIKITQQERDVLRTENDLIKLDYIYSAKLIKQLENTIKELKTPEIIYELPDFIKESKEIYYPTFQVVEWKNSKPSYVGYRMWNNKDIFTVTPDVQAIADKFKWADMPQGEALMQIWTYTSMPQIRQYKFDYGDNWQFATQTLNRKFGDCDDSSVLFVTLAHASGIPPTKIFLAIGYWGTGYHAFPIVNLTKEDINQIKGFDNVGILDKLKGWYIFESTVNGKPVRPKRIIGSRYVIDTGGIHNWCFSGHVKENNWGDFNMKGANKTDSKPGTKQTGAKECKEDRKAIIKKRIKTQKDIQKAWEEEGLIEKEVE